MHWHTCLSDKLLMPSTHTASTRDVLVIQSKNSLSELTNVGLGALESKIHDDLEFCVFLVQEQYPQQLHLGLHSDHTVHLGISRTLMHLSTRCYHDLALGASESNIRSLPPASASICEHQCIRSRCKQCVGVSICEHNRVRSGCKQCGG